MVLLFDQLQSVIAKDRAWEGASLYFFCGKAFFLQCKMIAIILYYNGFKSLIQNRKQLIKTEK